MRLEIVGEIVSRSPPELRDEPFCVETDVLKAIREADPDEGIELVIDSLGGSLTAGIAIYRALKNHPGSVTAKVEGYAASAASIVMCAADQIEVYNSSLIMIHGVQVVGEQISAANIQKLAGDIESLDSAIADIYVNRTGNNVETIRDWMNPEKWMSGADAVKLGFADIIRPEQRKAPAMENRARLQAKANPLTKEEMENFMKNIEDIGKELANACNPDKKKCEDDAAEDPKKDQEAENKPKAEADALKTSGKSWQTPAIPTRKNVKTMRLKIRKRIRKPKTNRKLKQTRKRSRMQSRMQRMAGMLLKKKKNPKMKHLMMKHLMMKRKRKRRNRKTILFKTWLMRSQKQSPMKTPALRHWMKSPTWMKHLMMKRKRKRRNRKTILFKTWLMRSQKQSPMKTPALRHWMKSPTWYRRRCLTRPSTARTK